MRPQWAVESPRRPFEVGIVLQQRSQGHLRGPLPEATLAVHAAEAAAHMAEPPSALFDLDQ
jgi:hypothetical protein